MLNKKVDSGEFIHDEEGLQLLANRIKTIRKEKKITQEELAFRPELSLSQIARIETLKINPTISTVFRIIQVLEVDLEEFFNFQLPPYNESRTINGK